MKSGTWGLKAIYPALLLANVPPTYGGLIEDFNSPSSVTRFTATTVLDSDAVAETTVSAPAGVLTFTHGGLGTNLSGPEQTLFLTPGTIQIGEQLRADFVKSGPLVYADMGLVFSAEPTALVYNVAQGGNQETRANFVTVYADPSFSPGRHTIKYNAFEGTASVRNGLVAKFASQLDGLYITRLEENKFEVGYSDNGVDFIADRFTIATANLFSQVGFISDIRSANTVGGLDNLRIVSIPEPTSLSIIGIALGLFAARRQRPAVHKQPRISPG